jgi:hypothetical protein
MLVYVLLRTAEMFAIRTCGPPLVRRWSERAAAQKDKVPGELGHQPTPEELRAYIRRRWEAKQSRRRGHDAAA